MVNNTRKPNTIRFENTTKGALVPLIHVMGTS